MLQPKRTKYRKMGRGRRKGTATTGGSVHFGEFGLKAMACDWVTARQIESARIAFTRSLQWGGQVWIRVFPVKPISKMPALVRMGGGKAANDHWVAVVKPGRILFEVGGVTAEQATDALRLASHKLPSPTKMVQRDRVAALTGGGVR